MYHRQFHRFISEDFVSNFIICFLNVRDVFNWNVSNKWHQHCTCDVCMIYIFASGVNFCRENVFGYFFCESLKTPQKSQDLERKKSCPTLYVQRYSYCIPFKLIYSFTQRGGGFLVFLRVKGKREPVARSRPISCRPLTGTNIKLKTLISDKFKWFITYARQIGFKTLSISETVSAVLIQFKTFLQWITISLDLLQC